MSQAPLLKLLVPLIVGIVIQYHLNDIWVDLVLGVFSVILFCVYLLPFVRSNLVKDWLFILFVISFCMLSGSFLLRQSLKKSDQKISSCNELYYGVLQEDPLVKKSFVNCKITLSDDKKIVAYIPLDSISLHLQAGDCICFHSILEKQKRSPDNSSFDYAAYLRKQGYTAITHIRKSDWKVYNHQSGLKFKSITFQRMLLEKMEELGLSEKSYQVGAAMLLGYKNALEPDLRTSFSVSGASHLLAVSGMHVSVLYGAIYFVFNLFFRNERHKKFIHLAALPLIWIFAFVTGLSPSVVRAVTMFTFVGFGTLTSRKSITLNTLSGAAFLMLIYEPLYLFDVSFQLSFLAVASIICINPVFKNLYENKGKLMTYLYDLFFVSFSAQLGTSPVTLFYFHQFPVYFWLTNILVIPLTGFLLVGLSIALIFQSVFDLPAWIYKPIDLLFCFFISIVENVEKLPFSSLKNIYLDEIQVIIIYCIIYFSFLSLYYKKAVYIYFVEMFALIQLIYYI